ncbi:MAG: SOS response-associated peptidase family protein [Mariniphaga sp.]
MITCKKFVLASTLEKIETRFNLRLDKNTIEIPKSYSVSSGDSSYVITSENPFAIQTFKFGMTPFYSTEPLNLINARAEGDKNSKNDLNYTGSKSIFLQTAFKKPVQYQRCLFLADAYYEWSSQNKPYLVYLQNKNRPFAFAGIYDKWQDQESKEIIFSFAIITTVANTLLQSNGVKRMPVILSRSSETAWIKASNHLSDVLRLLAPYPS